MNRNLYIGLKAIGMSIQLNSEPIFKYIGMWNNQLEKDKEDKIFSFRKPAMFFEFLPNTVDSVGAGVQIFDPLPVKIHVIDDMYDAKDGTNEVNLQVFDLGDLVYKNFQLNSVKGADYGTSPLNRTEVELDVDHDNLYHHITTFTTTWIDNSVTQPVGGYEIDPPLQAAITEIKMPIINMPVINVSETSLDFGSMAIGSHADLTFTIDGVYLPGDLIISTSYALFKVTWGTVFTNSIVLSPDGQTIPSTAITVRFSPIALGTFDGHINYGIPGLNNQITITGIGV